MKPTELDKPTLRPWEPTECSLYPKYECLVCGEKLWTMRAEVTSGDEWCFTLDGRRHYKNRCNMEAQCETATT